MISPQTSREVRRTGKHQLTFVIAFGPTFGAMDESTGFLRRPHIPLQISSLHPWMRFVTLLCGSGNKVRRAQFCFLAAGLDFRKVVGSSQASLKHRKHQGISSTGNSNSKLWQNEE